MVSYATKTATTVHAGATTGAKLTCEQDYSMKDRSDRACNSSPAADDDD
jgi:hypothetical protein